MVKSDLVGLLATRYRITPKEAERIVNVVLTNIGEALATGKRIELRGFGAFSVKQRPTRMGRNPRTGSAVLIAAKRMPHFRCGKVLRDRLNSLTLD